MQYPGINFEFITHAFILELRKFLKLFVVHLPEIKTKFNLGHAMSKIRNTGIADKGGFRHSCCVATATENLKDFRNSRLLSCSHHMAILKIQIFLIILA